MTPSIGIDFGGTTIKCGIVHDGTISHRGRTIDTMRTGDHNAIIDALITEIETMRKAQSGAEDVAAIGVGMPGIVDIEEGIVHRLSNVPGWRDVPLRDLLQQRTGIPAHVENDAKAMTYAEWKYGAARDGRNVVCITLGTGVGGGLILDGRLYRGSKFGAGEVGQMSIDMQGRPGNYGNLGALEKYVGNNQIAERAQRLYEKSGRLMTAADCTPAALDTAAVAGDTIARQLWAELGAEIGVALANVVWLLNPDAIVIGGGVARAGELLFEPIRTTIQATTMPTFYEGLRIVPAQLGNDAGIIGSASVALDTLKKS